MTEVVQLVPSFARYDAVGSFTRELDRLLAEMGYKTRIVADEALPGVESLAVPFSRFKLSPANRSILIYQASTTSRMASWLQNRHQRLIVSYHNITPWRQVAGCEPGVAKALRQARGEVAHLSERKPPAFTFSHFNRRDLARLGYKDATVLPPLIPIENLERAGVPDGNRWLFVGRVFPSKNQLLLLATLKAYRQAYDDQATLTMVGSAASTRYQELVDSAIRSLGLEEAVTVKANLDAAELRSEWENASLFVSASLHEGYGFPLVEAMASGIPVVALSRGAAGETVGGAGVLVHDATAEAMAAGCRLASGPLAAELIERGRERVAGLFDRSALHQRYRETLARLIG